MTVATKSNRINFRTSPEVEALIERTAAITSSKVFEFTLQNAFETCKRIVTQQELATVEKIGTHAIAVDAPDEAASAFYTDGDFQRFQGQALCRFLATQIIRWTTPAVQISSGT